DTSIGISYSLNNPLIMTDPSPKSALSFPVTLAAQSAQDFGQVNFYYQGSDGVPKLIGQSNNDTSTGNARVYSLTWSLSPPAGSYRLYAQTGDVTSPKIKVTVP